MKNTNLKCSPLAGTSGEQANTLQITHQTINKELAMTTLSKNENLINNALSMLAIKAGVVDFIPSEELDLLNNAREALGDLQYDRDVLRVFYAAARERHKTIVLGRFYNALHRKGFKPMAVASAEDSRDVKIPMEALKVAIIESADAADTIDTFVRVPHADEYGGKVLYSSVLSVAINDGSGRHPFDDKPEEDGWSSQVRDGSLESSTFSYADVRAGMMDGVEDWEYEEWYSQYHWNVLVAGYWKFYKEVTNYEATKRRIMEIFGDTYISEWLEIERSKVKDLHPWTMVKALLKAYVDVSKVSSPNGSGWYRRDAILRRIKEENARGYQNGMDSCERETAHGDTDNEFLAHFEYMEGVKSVFDRVHAETWDKMLSHCQKMADAFGLDMIDLRPTYWVGDNHAETIKEVKGFVFEEVEFADKETGELIKRYAHRWANVSEFKNEFESLVGAMRTAYRVVRDKNRQAKNRKTKEDVAKVAPSRVAISVEMNNIDF